MLARRKDVEDVKHDNVSHAGLWFDRYLAKQNPREGNNTTTEAYKEHVQHTCNVAQQGDNGLYEQFYGRWKQTLTEMGATCLEAEAAGNLAVGLGSESVIETSITLHHTYGLPYIPGSAIKGAAASFAHQRIESDAWRRETKKGDKIVTEWGDAYKAVFGTPDMMGYVTFHDALYVPASGKDGKPLFPDVMTPHHADYYGGKKPDEDKKSDVLPPADWDDPNPVSFIRATGSYLIAFSVESDELIEPVTELLKMALAQFGVGGKTSSGYGRFKFNRDDSANGESQEDVDSELVDLQNRLNSLSEAQIKPQLQSFANQCFAMNDDPERQKQATRIIVDTIDTKFPKYRKDLDKKLTKKPNHFFGELLKILSEA